jgi:hypothetical protein
MVIGIAVAALLAASPVAQARPLREVVYRANYSRRSNTVRDRYRGATRDQYGENIDMVSDSGLITVDVLAVADDGISVRVTEQFGSPPRPLTTMVIIFPDGTLRYGANDLNDTSVALLPFFGAKFVEADQVLDVGSSWTRELHGGPYAVDTKFTVEKIDGPIITLNEARTIRNRTVNGSDATVTGSVDYKPQLLCPVAGTLTERTSSVGLDYNADITVSLQFQRVSDTNDPPTKGL